MRLSHSNGSKLHLNGNQSFITYHMRRSNIIVENERLSHHSNPNIDQPCRRESIRAIASDKVTKGPDEKQSNLVSCSPCHIKSPSINVFSNRIYTSKWFLRNMRVTPLKGLKRKSGERPHVRLSRRNRNMLVTSQVSNETSKWKRLL